MRRGTEVLKDGGGAVFFRPCRDSRAVIIGYLPVFGFQHLALFRHRVSPFCFFCGNNLPAFVPILSICSLRIAWLPVRFNQALSTRN